MIISLITYFIIYSFLGWIIESVYRSLRERKLINTGFLYGPFCPIYGLGAIIMFLFLNNFRDNIFVLFILSFFILSLWEYIVGWILEIIFHTKYWDYTENKFNINGRVCLVNSIFWGILGVIFIKFIHPFTIAFLDELPQDTVFIGTIILFGIVLIDVIVTIIKVKNIDIKINKFSELNDIIKAKLNELKELTQNATETTKDSIQAKIDELKREQGKLKNNILKQTIRLKKAFPTMKSEKISHFLSQKIDEIRHK